MQGIYIFKVSADKNHNPRHQRTFSKQPNVGEKTARRNGLLHQITTNNALTFVISSEAVPLGLLVELLPTGLDGAFFRP
jgi:hypothetical protein